MSDPLIQNDEPVAEVVRVSRDGGRVVFRMPDGAFSTYSTSGEFLKASTELKSLLAGASWRRPVNNEPSSLVASVFSSDIIEVSDTKTYRVPAQVQEAVSAKLGEMASSLTAEDMAKATALASGDPVGRDEIIWVVDYFRGNDDSDQIRGGFKGRKWAEKILEEDDAMYSDHDPFAKYRFDDGPDMDYMALGPDEDSSEANRLLQINWATGDVLVWTSDGFERLYEDDVDSFEYPMIFPVDATTAGVFAKWLDENPYQTYDLRDTDVEERNLFDTAYDDLDFDDMDRTSSILADASGYTPAERSLNARRQVRGFHGRFGGKQVKQTTKLKAFKKGHLAGGPVIDPNPGKTIKSWLADQAPVTAAAEQGRSQSIAQPAADPRGKSQASADKTKQITGKSASEAKQDSEEPSDKMNDAIYFAIVDVNDATAVLDVVSITRNDDGQPEAWRRVKGEWKADPDTLAKLMGSTPPAVVQLDNPDVLKAVLKQVDDNDANPNAMPSDAVPNSAPPSMQASASFEIADVEDLKAFLSTTPDEILDDATRIYLRRRATALNRLDVIPEPWRVPTAAERGFEVASTSPLFGDFGEVLTAAGHPFQGARGAERLKEYWTHGKGALKIRWGTPGDLTRAHRHLAKFVGPDRAWGLAERYHEHALGMSNRKHDKLTGQTRHGGR